MNTKEIMLELDFWNVRMIDFVHLSSGIQKRGSKGIKTITFVLERCSFKIIFIQEFLSIRKLVLNDITINME